MPLTSFTKLNNDDNRFFYVIQITNTVDTKLWRNANWQGPPSIPYLRYSVVLGWPGRLPHSLCRRDSKLFTWSGLMALNDKVQARPLPRQPDSHYNVTSALGVINAKRTCQSRAAISTEDLRALSIGLKLSYMETVVAVRSVLQWPLLRDLDKPKKNLTGVQSAAPRQNEKAILFLLLYKQYKPRKSNPLYTVCIVSRWMWAAGNCLQLCMWCVSVMLFPIKSSALQPFVLTD